MHYMYRVPVFQVSPVVILKNLQIKSLSTNVFSVWVADITLLILEAINLSAY